MDGTIEVKVMLGATLVLSYGSGVPVSNLQYRICRALLVRPAARCEVESRRCDGV